MCSCYNSLFKLLQRNMYLMIPWVLLGIMLAIGLLVSVIYTSVDFYIKKDALNGSLFLVLGLISFGMYFDHFLFDLGH